MKYSKTYLKNVERFERQRERMRKIQTAYDTYSKSYYGKSKRHNLLSNQYEALNRNPLSLTPSALNKILRDNARAIRELGFNSRMSGDLAEASVLTELNNESFSVVDFSESEADEYDLDFIQSEQERVFGDMLFESLKNLRLTHYQLDRVLSRSILPDYITGEVKDKLLDFWKKLRR